MFSADFTDQRAT